MTNPEVRIGQVWQSTDPRDGGRQMIVESFGPLYAYMKCVATGRRSTIKKHRMRYSLGGRGYELVSDPLDAPKSG